MPIVVEVPNRGSIEFDDGATDADIEAIVSKEFPPTPDDSYNKVLQFQAAQIDYTPSKQEFLDYLKVSKTKPLLGDKPLETIGTAAVQTAKDIATMPYKLGEAVGEIYQPPDGATEGDVALGTASEIAAQSKLKAQSMARGAYDVALSNLEKLTGKLRSDDDRYEAFLATSEIKRQLSRANAPEEQRVPAAQEFLQAYNIPQEALSQPGLEVGGFLADPSSIAFAGGGKAASALLQRALPLIPRAGQMLQRGGERISTLGQAPETGAGALATKITGSPQMGQAVQEAIAKGTTGVALGEAAGLPITAQLNVPGLGTASQIIGGTKALGATLETIGEAGAVSGGPALTAIQRGLLGAGERIAAAEGASAGAKAFGNAIARSGLEAPIKGAGAILVPMVGAGVGGAALAGLTGEEGDAIAAAFGSGAAFGAFDAGFHLAKAASADAFKGGRVRQTAVDDLNTRPTEVQFTYVDPVAGEQTSTIKDADARAQLYASLNNKQLTKALSEVAGAEGAGVDVIFHTNADTVPTALQTVNYAGVAIGPDNIKSGKPTILINVDRAKPEAIPHEILHARITQDMVSQLGGRVIDAASTDPAFKQQFSDFANRYADKIEASGGRVIADRVRTELRDSFDPNLQRAQQVESLKRITDEFSAYYTQEMLKGKDPKTMLPGRIPSFIEMALNNAKEAVSERFTRRALQAGFDPVARSFYDSNGRRIKIDWMEDAIKNLVTPKEGYEPTEQKVDINKMTKAQQNALIMARGYSDLFMTAPDGSIVRPLSKAELAAKTADVANRTMKVVESVPQADRTSVSGMDAKGNPVIEGRLSLAEADAVSKSGIFSPSTSRSLIDIAMGIRDGTLMEGKYWKVYGSTGKSGVFGESEKLFLPYGISINSKGGVNVKVVDWGKVQARMYKALTKPAYKNLFRNYDQAMSTLKDVYLKNIAEQNAAPSAEALGGGIEGAKKRNFFNEVMGAVPKKGDVMSNLPTAGYVANRKGGSVYQDLRIERLQNTNPTGAKIPWTGDMGEQSSYRRTQLNFQPAETIGETQVSTDQNGGYRILSKNGKFRLYGPDGSTAGIFDTEGQAKLKAEKDYATQARLQPEVRQQQYPARDEVRQTAEAGRGDSAVGRTQGREEGRQELGAVRQAGDVITPESPEVAKKVVSGDTSALKDGELLGTFRFMPPDLIDKLAVTDEQRQAMRGKSGFAFVSDWADAGRPYVTRLGRNIDVLMGGMGYPFLPEISGKGAWAGTFSGMTDTVMKKIKATDGIGLVVLGGPESSASSRAFSRAFGEELADSMSQNPKLKEKLDKIARNARKQWIEYRRGEGKSIDVPEINSLEDWARLTQLERAGEQSERGLTFSDRDFLVRTIGSHDNKKALGIRSWKDVLRNYNLQNKDFTPGQVVAVVQFSGAEPVRAETVGAKVHPSYEALIPGKAIGTLPQKTMIKDVFRDFLSKTQPPAFTRKIQTNMPKFVVGEGDMRFMPDQQGFYSKLEEVVNAKLPKVASPQQVLASVDPGKGSGVKPEELKWTGFAQAVERIAKENGGKVPKEKLIEHLKNEGRVKFEEVTSGIEGKSITQDEVDRLERRAQRTQSNDDWRAYEDAVLRFESQELGTEAQYSKYQLPGGENYREVVLTSDIAAPYTSSHFNDIPNYVAHMRVNERADASGKPGLFVEEIQSDRHQQARDQGYKEDKGTDWSKVPVYQYKDLVAGGVFPEVLHIEVKDGIYKLVAPDGGVHLMESSLEKLKKNYDRSRMVEGVSDAPFRKDWSLQMFKRALRDAVASGKEWIGWTTGVEQVKRYENDFRKSVDTIQWNDEGLKHNVVAIKDGESVFSGRFDLDGKGLQLFNGEEASLSDVVGKDIAAQIIKGEGKASGVNQAEWSGSDMTIGGEGMKGFYDKILPSEVQKYVKQWGSEVKKSEVNTGQGKPTEYADFSEYQKARKEGQKTTIWRVDITPEMRKSVSETGQPRFMPAGDMASGRSVKDHREAMDLFEKGYKLYGALYDGMEDPVRLKKATEIERFDPENLWAVPPRRVAAAIAIRNMPADLMPQPDSSMPGAYTFTGGYRALPGKAKGSLRIYGPAGSLIGIASSLDEAQRILRRKAK